MRRPIVASLALVVVSGEEGPMKRTQSLDAANEAPLDATTAQPNSLRGRVALVTGAAGDLGRGIAERSRRATRSCSAPTFAATADSWRRFRRSRQGTRTRRHRLWRGGARLRALRDDHGRLDILCEQCRARPSAGTARGHLGRGDRQVLDVNVKGVPHCARAAARMMIGTGSGRIINIASQAGKCGVANWAVYCASKAAVIAATQAQALELAAPASP